MQGVNSGSGSRGQVTRTASVAPPPKDYAELQLPTAKANRPVRLGLLARVFNPFPRTIGTQIQIHRWYQRHSANAFGVTC